MAVINLVLLTEMTERTALGGFAPLRPEGHGSQEIKKYISIIHILYNKNVSDIDFGYLY